MEELKNNFYMETSHLLDVHLRDAIWSWIESKITEAKIEENERWLAHANRFSDDVPLHLKKINRSELKDRIKELKDIK